MTNEVELKLRIQPSDILHLRRHAAVAQVSTGKPVTRKLTSIYFDTPELALLDAGISLRVRHMSGGWFQSVKGAGTSFAGLHQRKEWEDIIASPQPDFSKITAPELTRIFDDPQLRNALRPIFTTAVRRTEWHLALDNGTLVEMALDQGELIVGTAREPIREIELELKHGQPSCLFNFALTLQADIPLWIENISKAERGYAYYRQEKPGALKAKPARLHPAMHLNDAWENILQTCITQLQANHDVILKTDAPEGVHQMRIALRRLRSAFSIFQDRMPDDGKLVTELRWLATTLGHVRDLDVFLTQTLPPVLAQFDHHPGMQQLHEKALQARQKTHAELCLGLESQRYQRLLLELGSRIENLHHSSADPILTEFAHATLQKRFKILKRHGKDLHARVPEERHAARIAAKKLRYASEFFATLYQKHHARSFLKHLVQLQDILGTLNDITVTRTVLDRLAGKRPEHTLTEALSIIEGWCACHGKLQLPLMHTAWHDVMDAEPFWN